MTRIKNAILLLTGLALALVASGCILEQVDHSLYLDEDGGVTWVAVERDVRSDAADPAERATEETAFRDQTLAGEHPAAVALRLLGGAVRGELVRSERPLMVVTEGRFTRVDGLAEAYFEALGMPAKARFERIGELRELEIVLRLADQEDDLAHDEMIALVAEPERYRLVLTEGAFEDAVGFTLTDGDTAAIPLGLGEEALAAMGQTGAEVVHLVLRWRVPSG